MAKILTRCPVCEAALHVTELACARCHTAIRGEFETCRFCRLAPEHLAFVEMFLRNEGNLSRVGAQLGLSYPTVRNKLAAALNALGFGEDADNDSNAAFPAAVTNAERDTAPTPEMLERRRDVLERLAQGSISAHEAAEALRENL
jgi:hypothetical protein